MPLKIEQRIERLQTRLRETAFWRARADARDRRLALRQRANRSRRAVAEPRGHPALRGRSARSRRLAARGDAPVARPRRREPADARLRRRRARRLRPRRQPSGVSPRQPPLRHRRRERRRLPFGQPVADPRLRRARLDLARPRARSLRRSPRRRRRGGGDARRARSRRASRRSGGSGAARDRLALVDRRLHRPRRARAGPTAPCGAPGHQARSAPLSESERASIIAATPHCARSSPRCSAAFRRRAKWR